MKKSGLIILVVILLAILAMNATFTVREDQYACTVRFSKIIDTTDQAGLHFKIPFLDNVKYFATSTSELPKQPRYSKASERYSNP